jgi:hypothetical protein
VKKRTTKNNIKQRKPIRRPGPYRSQLIPYVDQIKAWRRAGKTWKQVTEELAKLNPPVKTDPATAYRFIMRWKKRPYPYGKDQAPEPAQPATNPQQPTKPASAPAPVQPDASGKKPKGRARQDYTRHQAELMKKKSQHNEQGFDIHTED